MLVNRDHPEGIRSRLQDHPGGDGDPSGGASLASVLIVGLRDWPTTHRLAVTTVVVGAVLLVLLATLAWLSPNVRIAVGPVEFEHKEPVERITVLPCTPPAPAPVARPA
jgi:hypothetical protein